MKTVILSAIAAFSFATAGTAVASDYTYVEATYTATDWNDTSGATYGINGSLAVTDHIFVTAGYSNGLDADFDVGIAYAGVGFQTPVASATNVYVKAEATSVTSSWRDSDRWAWRGEVGLRHDLTERFEVRGGVTAEDIRVRDNIAYTGFVGAEYRLTEYLAVNAQVRGKDDFTAGTVGLRLYF